MRKTLVALASIPMLVTLAGQTPAQSAPAHAAAQTVAVKDYDLATMTRGPDITLPHLVGGTVHHGGTTIVIPAQFYRDDDQFHDSLRLIGRGRDNSYLVARERDDEEYFQHSADILRVTPTGTSVIASSNLGGDDNDDDYYWRLNSYRNNVVEWDAEAEAAWSSGVIRDLEGTNVRARSFSSDLDHPLDLRGVRVVVSDGERRTTRIWNTNVNQVRVLTKKPSVFADLAHNALAPRGTSGRWAWSSITAPTRVKWQAWFRPQSVSPSGYRVVGWATQRDGDLTRVLQVRRTTDGKLISAFRFTGTPQQATVAWESDRAVAVEVAQPKGYASAIVRCAAGGGCARASDIHPDGAFTTSVEFETAGYDVE